MSEQIELELESIELINGLFDPIERVAWGVKGEIDKVMSGDPNTWSKIGMGVAGTVAPFATISMILYDISKDIERAADTIERVEDLIEKIEKHVEKLVDMVEEVITKVEQTIEEIKRAIRIIIEHIDQNLFNKYYARLTFLLTKSNDLITKKGIGVSNVTAYKDRIEETVEELIELLNQIVKSDLNITQKLFLFLPIIPQWTFLVNIKLFLAKNYNLPDVSIDFGSLIKSNLENLIPDIIDQKTKAKGLLSKRNKIEQYVISGCNFWAVGGYLKSSIDTIVHNNPHRSRIKPRTRYKVQSTDLLMSDKKLFTRDEFLQTFVIPFELYEKYNIISEDSSIRAGIPPRIEHVIRYEGKVSLSNESLINGVMSIYRYKWDSELSDINTPELQAAFSMETEDGILVSWIGIEEIPSISPRVLAKLKSYISNDEFGHLKTLRSVLLQTEVGLFSSTKYLESFKTHELFID